MVVHAAHVQIRCCKMMVLSSRKEFVIVLFDIHIFGCLFYIRCVYVDTKIRFLKH